jgi:hypothetical protein
MKRLPPAKRNQLIGVIIATAVLICGVYFFMISPQNAKNRDLGVQIGTENARLQQYKTATTTNQMTAAAAALADVSDQLERAESDVASGDLYAWTVATMQHFKEGYHNVDIPEFGQPVQSDCDLIGNFPYKQIRFAANGTAYYHDLGKFVADFENKFPHCRIVNFSADPVGGSEKLNFKMDIVALVRPSN